MWPTSINSGESFYSKGRDSEGCDRAPKTVIAAGSGAAVDLPRDRVQGLGAIATIAARTWPVNRF
ncbi:MAG: hypothetical protein ACFB0G_04960 [Leptolyngbyaceae cyanobacterium]